MSIKPSNDLHPIALSTVCVGAFFFTDVAPSRPMFPGVLCKRATTIQELYLTQRTPHTDHCGSRRWQGGKNRRRHKRSFTTDTEVNQMLLHSLVNEQQSKQTSETCSSFSGSPSQHPHLGLMYFQYLYLYTTHLVQRSSPEGSLVHVHR